MNNPLQSILTSSISVNHNTLLLLGLYVAFTGATLLLVFAVFEGSYDTLYEKADTSYRITTPIERADETYDWAITSGALRPLLLSSVSGIEDVTKLLITQSIFTFSVNDNSHVIKSRTGFFADTSFFNIFSSESNRGFDNRALSPPNSIEMVL